MKLEKCKKVLRKYAETCSYKSDSADTMFRVYVLEFLQKITNKPNENLKIEKILNRIESLTYQMAKDIKKLRLKKPKKEPSKYNLHIAEEIKKGKTFEEAVKSWKKKDYTKQEEIK